MNRGLQGMSCHPLNPLQNGVPLCSNGLLTDSVLDSHGLRPLVLYNVQKVRALQPTFANTEQAEPAALHSPLH